MRSQRLAMLVMALIAVIMTALTGRHSGSTPELTACSVSQTSAHLVQLSGDFYHPGMYALSLNFDNKLTESVINMAKPFCPERIAAASSLPVVSQTTGRLIRLNCKSADINRLFTVSSIAPAQLLTLGIPLDLNRLQTEELELLPGIGPRLAQRIVNYRQINGDYVSLEELKQVEGIGEKTFVQLLHYIKITN